MGHWIGRIFSFDEPEVEPVPETQPEGVWCNGCDRWTGRDPLPGTKFGDKEIPTWWFCTYCGIADWDYLPEEAA